MNAAKNCKKRGRHRCAGAQKRTPARGIRTGEQGIVVAPMPNFYDDNIYTKFYVWRECSAAAAGITRTRVAGSAQRLSQATLLAHAAQGTGSRTLTMVGFLSRSLSRIKLM